MPENEMMELWRGGSPVCTVSGLDLMEPRFLHIFTAPDYREEYIMWTPVNPGPCPGPALSLHFPVSGSEWRITLAEEPEFYGEGWCSVIRRESGLPVGRQPGFPDKGEMARGEMNSTLVTPEAG